MTMNTQETLAQLKQKLKDAWVRGKEQRIEIGTLLLELRKKAKHGTWGQLLAEVGIPAQTAGDYMVEASRQIHGIRVFENGELTTQPDPEAVEMEQAVNAATALVNGEAPVPPQPKPQLAEHNRVKGPVLFCTAPQKEAYESAKKQNKERVYQLFFNALMEVIGEQEVANESLAA
jgi:hypothetical protein